MLILTRRRGESIIINDDIKVQIVSIRGDEVRLGIDAPSHVAVDREEIHVRKVKEREAAGHER